MRENKGKIEFRQFVIQKALQLLSLEETFSKFENSQKLATTSTGVRSLLVMSSTPGTRVRIDFQTVQSLFCQTSQNCLSAALVVGPVQVVNALGHVNKLAHGSVL